MPMLHLWREGFGIKPRVAGWAPLIGVLVGGVALAWRSPRWSPSLGVGFRHGVSRCVLSWTSRCSRAIPAAGSCRRGLVDCRCNPRGGRILLGDCDWRTDRSRRGRRWRRRVAAATGNDVRRCFDGTCNRNPCSGYEPRPALALVVSLCRMGGCTCHATVASSRDYRRGGRLATLQAVRVAVFPRSRGRSSRQPFAVESQGRQCPAPSGSNASLTRAVLR
jgi:hypothetical protein